VRKKQQNYSDSKNIPIWSQKRVLTDKYSVNSGTNIMIKDEMENHTVTRLNEQNTSINANRIVRHSKNHGENINV
jgi:hypothetical protein